MSKISQQSNIKINEIEKCLFEIGTEMEKGRWPKYSLYDKVNGLMLLVETSIILMRDLGEEFIKKY